MNFPGIVRYVVLPRPDVSNDGNYWINAIVFIAIHSVLIAIVIPIASFVVYVIYKVFVGGHAENVILIVWLPAIALVLRVIWLGFFGQRKEIEKSRGSA